MVSSPRAKSAQKTRKVAVRLPATDSAPENWLRNIRVSGFAFMVLGLIVLAIVVLAPSLRTLVQQQQQIAALQAAVDAKRDEVKDLTSDVARWDDPAYVEAQARERIYYVYPGEYPYIVIGDATADATATDGSAISDQIQQTQVNWLQSVVSSVFTAGLTDATPDELDSSDEGDTK